MARSIKKGQFIDAHLLKKVDAARDSNDKRPIKDKQEINNWCFADQFLHQRIAQW